MKASNVLTTYKEQVWIVKVVYGFLIALSGVFGLFPNTVCSTISLVLVFAAISLVSRKIYANPNREESDEMAELNMMKAESWTLKIMRIVSLAVFALLMLLPDEWMSTLSWKDVAGGVVFLLCGCLDMMTGFKFRKLEEE